MIISFFFFIFFRLRSKPRYLPEIGHISSLNPADLGRYPSDFWQISCSIWADIPQILGRYPANFWMSGFLLRRFWKPVRNWNPTSYPSRTFHPGKAVFYSYLSCYDVMVWFQSQPKIIKIMGNNEEMIII